MPRKPRTGACLKWILDNVSHGGDECLIWPYSITRGYGHFSIDGTLFYAHRHMCEMVKGPPPTPKHQASHSCGRGDKGCVNPNHLSWKTNGQNQLDRREHGTKNKSGWRWTPKLTAEQVRQIRAMEGRKTQDQIAAQFGIGRRNVGAILSRRSWQHV